MLKSIEQTYQSIRAFTLLLIGLGYLVAVPALIWWLVVICFKR